MAFSSSEPTILLACGRNRELWGQPLWKNKGNNRILVIRLTAHLHLWRMPEMVAPRALDSCRRPEGSYALGSRMLSWRIVQMQSCVLPYALACCFMLLSTFWRRGWPRLHPNRRLIPSNRPAAWVSARTDGKHVYNIISMLVESLLTIANGRCYFTSPGRHSKASLLPYLTLELQSWTKVLGQIYICGAFSHAPNKFIYTCSAPRPLLQCWKRVHAISPEFQHCIGGLNWVGGRNAF